MLNAYSHSRPGVINQATVAAHIQQHSADYGAMPVAIGVNRRDLDAAAAALVALGYTWMPVQVQPGCLQGEIMLEVGK